MESSKAIIFLTSILQDLSENMENIKIINHSELYANKYDITRNKNSPIPCHRGLNKGGTFERTVLSVHVTFTCTCQKNAV